MEEFSKSKRNTLFNFQLKHLCIMDITRQEYKQPIMSYTQYTSVQTEVEKTVIVHFQSYKSINKCHIQFSYKRF